MRVYESKLESPNTEAIADAVDAIKRGELVIFPTETVYGLACDALNAEAVRRLIEAKGRADGHPLPVQVAGVEQLDLVASDVPESAGLLAEKFWPGPLTMVLPAKSVLSDLVTAGKGTIGVRVPNHPVALAMLRALETPIVATSANLTGNAPATDAQQAIEELGKAVAVVLDAGRCKIGVASTVVDLTIRPPHVLRCGAIRVHDLEEVLGEVTADND